MLNEIDDGLRDAAAPEPDDQAEACIVPLETVEKLAELYDVGRRLLTARETAHLVLAEGRAAELVFPQAEVTELRRLIVQLAAFRSRARRGD